MTLFKHELKQNLKSFLTWALSIGVFIFFFILIFPTIKDAMAEFNDMIESLGVFGQLFNLGSLDMSTIDGYFATDAGMVVMLGGAMYAGFMGVGLLTKEEGYKTSDFLLTTPVSRTKIFLSKMMTGIIYIIGFHIIVYFITFLSVLVINEPFTSSNFILFFIANAILHLEIFLLLYGISVVFRKSSLAPAVGFTIGLYFVNLIKNITTDLDWLKYITPFAYADAGYIWENGALQWRLIALGIVIAVMSVTLGLIYYNKKDIYA